MAEYIDVEKARAYVETDLKGDPVLQWLGRTMIEKLPRVEACRCGNCKYYVENHYGDMVCQHPEQDGDWLDAAWLNTNPDDFCSRGENKEASPDGDVK